MTREELGSVMLQIGAQPWSSMVADAEYSLPARDWIEQEFSRELESLLGDLYLKGWVSQSWDCDDFADTARWLAKVKHAKTRPGKSAIAFGCFWFKQDRGQGHAINVAVVRERERNQVVFYEPQTREIITLSQAEIASCSAYLF